MKRFFKVFFVISVFMPFHHIVGAELNFVTLKLGELLYKNEAAGLEKYIAFWNSSESFPSLGICHAIWFPKGIKNKKYTEQFPDLCAFLSSNGIIFPTWLDHALSIGAPWKNRDEFIKDTDRVQELRTLLVATTGLQAQYVVDRYKEKIPEIIKASKPEKREVVRGHVIALQKTGLGTYACVDYLNFKGDGLNAKEKSKGQQWGLLQVLEGMKYVDPEKASEAFAASAAVTLAQLVQNSGPEYKRMQFLSGWMKRIATYADRTLFKEAKNKRKIREITTV